MKLFETIAQGIFGLTPLNSRSKNLILSYENLFKFNKNEVRSTWNQEICWRACNLQPYNEELVTEFFVQDSKEDS